MEGFAAGNTSKEGTQCIIAPFVYVSFQICSMVHLHEEMYKLCAGEDWKVMRTECIRKVRSLLF